MWENDPNRGVTTGEGFGMTSEDSVLKELFLLVRESAWVTARKLGGGFDGGKSLVNHYLYGFEGLLFEKEGDRPPFWRVISDDAYDKYLKRVQAPKARGSGPVASHPEFASHHTIHDLAPITLCHACDTPIRPNGMCRCS